MRPSVGILMLDNRVPRIPGDIGDPGTFGFPVEHKRVPGSTHDRVVFEPDRALIDAFVAGAKELERAGASSITTSCGFLAMWQPEIATGVRVPVFTSSLLLVPLVHRMIAGRRVGILTAVSTALTDAHFEAAGWSPAQVPIAVRGMEGCPGFRGYIDDHDEVDVDLIGREMADAAGALVQGHPDVGAIVLECTNMAPYAHHVQRVTGLPVFDVQLLTELVHAATHRQAYDR